MAKAVCNGPYLLPVTLNQRPTAHLSHQSSCFNLLGADSFNAFGFHNSSVQGLYISSNSNTSSRPGYSGVSSRCSRFNGVVHSKLVRFSGRKEVSISFQEKSYRPAEYLKETERIVKVTFPDSARLKYLGNSVWQARLMPTTFFNFSATPYCDIRVVHDNGALIIDSNKLILDVTGLPAQFRNLDLQLSLHGELRVFPQSKAPKAIENHGKWDFGGWVNLGVGVDLPLPLSFIPDRLLTGVGNQVVDRILGAMEGALLQGIINDYDKWCALPNRVPSGNPDRATSSA